jgi:hypothetical protein
MAKRVDSRRKTRGNGGPGPGIASLEEMLTEMLAFECLRLARVCQIDFQVAPEMFQRVVTGLLSEGPFAVTQEVDKQTETILVRRELDPELITRYGTSVSKQIHRILGHRDSKKMRLEG